MAKIVFFGTPDYVVPILDALLKHHEILAVVTQPPKPAGRKQTLTPSPVAQWAGSHKIPVYTDITLLCNSVKADAGILAAYGRLVPKATIEHFPHGIINIHPSLLPKYRGASPIQAAISGGEKETGVTIIKLDEEMDHGPILAQFTESIKSDDTTGSLRERLFKKAAETLLAILPAYTKSSSAYLDGNLAPREQEHEKATYTKIIKKEDGFIPGKSLEAALSGEASPYPLERFIRSVDPWPGAYTNVNIKNQISKRLKILKAHVEPFLLMPNAQSLVPDLVQLEGKNSVSWQQFVQGYPDFQLV